MSTFSNLGISFIFSIYFSRSSTLFFAQFNSAMFFSNSFFCSKKIVSNRVESLFSVYSFILSKGTFPYLKFIILFKSSN